MRFLTWDDQGNLQLTDDVTDDRTGRKPYAILSHTWGPDCDEVTFADLQQRQGQSKAGYAKLRFCAEQSRKDQIDCVWVDTCCIDKTNLVELSEAITSMFRWYCNATKCYVYLTDVSARSNDHKDEEKVGKESTWESSFRLSRWFTRGWTLQELLAPAHVEFFSCEGTFLGTKTTLAQQIHEVTTIPLAALNNTPLSQFPVAERLRWVENRQTKKREDRAYCLLGMFDVYMSLRYGEGDNAFRRLQKKIDSQCKRRKTGHDLPTGTDSLSLLSAEPELLLTRKQPRASALQHQKSACQKGICSCPCHRSKHQLRVSTALSLARFLTRCQCQSRELRFNISFLQRILDIQLNADWTYGLTLNGSLKLRATVKRTSPGFVVIAKCYYGVMDFEKARGELCELKNHGFIDFTDVTRGGDGMLEEVIRRPWGVNLYDLQFQLVEFLINAGAPKNSERLLEIILTNWVGEGPYLSLLEDLVRRSLDAADITSSLLSRWPRAANVNWCRPYNSGDPFFLQAVTLLSRSDPEFGGTTELQAAVLENDRPLVETLSKRIPCLSADKNFLGQSMLHLSVLNPSMAAHVLHTCHDVEIDAGDASDTTPLMYAISYGMTKSASLLLEAGADPFRRDNLNNFCAWDYALILADQELLAALIGTYLTLKPNVTDQVIVYCLWSRILLSFARFRDTECEKLSYLLQPSIGHDCISAGGNTLLHLCNSWEVPLVLHSKSIPLNKANKHGYTPLMVIARSRDPTLVKLLIAKGALVSHVDKHQRNALHHLISGLIAHDCWSLDLKEQLSIMEPVAVLLSYQDDLNHGDACRCLCSSSGCTPLAYFFSNSHWPAVQIRNIQHALCLLDCFIIMQHTRPAEVQVLLQGLFRRQRFDELGMTHTCCTRRTARLLHSEKFDYTPPMHDERNFWQDAADGLNQDGQNNDLCEEDTDTEEIRDEERRLAQELHGDCNRFAVETSEDVEAAWISLLSRRVVMMEEALRYAKVKSDEQNMTCRSKRREVCGEIITLSPLCYVDHKIDKIVEVHDFRGISFPWKRRIVFENYVREYLAFFEKNKVSLSTSGGGCMDAASWDQRRRYLAALLLKSVEQLRDSPKEQRDWDMNIEDC